MLSEQVYFLFFFLVFIHVIPGAWSISKCCPNSIRISSWLRRNSHCGERRSHRVLYPYIRSGTISCHVTAFLYWKSPRLHLFNTNTERWHQLQNKLLGMTCWKWNQNGSRVSWQHANYHSWNSVEVQCFPGFIRIKQSNAAEWYMWNITDILPDESCVDMTS